MYSRWFSEYYVRDGHTAFIGRLAKPLIDYYFSRSGEPLSHLDLGCGDGSLSIHLKARFPGVRTRGVDLSEPMIELARRNASEAGVAIDFCVGDMVHYVDDEFYDLVTCTYDAVNHLESFDDWLLFFESARNRLADGGLFIFDFNTLQKLAAMEIVTFNRRNPGYDFANITIPLDASHAAFHYVFYIEGGDGRYDLHRETVIHSFAGNQEIVDGLLERGLEVVDIFDADFLPCSLDSESTRLFLACERTGARPVEGRESSDPDSCHRVSQL